jgi:hypothetical protein
MTPDPEPVPSVIVPSAIVLSVIVAIVSDTTGLPDANHLGPCLAALTQQTGAPAMEIIVPHLPEVAGIAAVRNRYPGVRFVEITDLKTYTGRSGSREHHDELRSRGIALARGRIVALIEDVGAAAPGWAAAMVASHERPFSGIGGAIENGVDRPLNWAVYFCDFLRYQNPLPEGESPIASDANVSYKMAALEKIRPVWREVFHEASVNGALRERGERFGLAPGAVVYQRRRGLQIGSALRERFVWGRSYAATRARLAGTPRRVFWAVFAPALPLILFYRMTAMAAAKRRTLGAYIKASPLLAALVVGSALGEFSGYLTGRANKTGAPAAEAIARGTR